jgi:hypothetical protein
LRDNVMPQVNPDEIAFVSLNVDSFDSDESLAAYMTAQGFDWTFAVASSDMVNALVDAFGANVIIPPVQPHFVIYPDASTSGLLTGNPSAEEVLALLRLQEFQSRGSVRS